MKNLTHTKIINEIIENVRDDMQDEEIIHLVLEKTVALPDGKDFYHYFYYITNFLDDL